MHVFLQFSREGIAHRRTHLCHSINKVLKTLCGSHGIGELQFLRIGDGVAIDEDLLTAYFQFITGESYATLDEVLTFVDRTYDNLAEDITVVENCLTPVFTD